LQLTNLRVLLVGCGKMGSALLKGWLCNGLRLETTTVYDPYPSQWLSELASQGLKLNSQPDMKPDIVVLATKPQLMETAVPECKRYGNGSAIFLSIAAGTQISSLETMLGERTPIVRAMPNTPAAVSRGISGITANHQVTDEQLDLAQNLMATVGETVLLENEEQMHAVTGLSGSGPAYIFAMTEAMTQAGIEAGLPTKVAERLAVSTVAGAGHLMLVSGEKASTLREQVTSPNGTTYAGLKALACANEGLEDLMRKTIRAAQQRSEELAQNSIRHDFK